MKSLLKKIPISVLLLLFALSCSNDDGNPVSEQIVKGEMKQIVNFSFQAAQNEALETDMPATVNETAKTIVAVPPSGTDISALVPQIKISPKASIAPNGPQDFTKTVTYTVTAEDGSFSTYAVTINITPNSQKQVLGFVFLDEGNSALKDDVTAVVDEDNKAITATLPNGTNAKVLSPTLEISAGATISPEGAQNFTEPVAYTITAEDGTSATYDVVVEVLTDRKILIRLYNANPGNTLEWDIKDEDISSWKGVTTNTEGKVVELDVANSELSVLPTEIGQLDALSKFSFVNNGLMTLPSEFGNLNNLMELNVRGNDLGSLPPEIGRLIHLEKLIINDNDLVSLPEEVGQLIALTLLDIGNNELGLLPSTIGSLIHLEELGLHNNKLKSLPDTIGNLSSLITIFLEDNELKDLPIHIGNLTTLETLDLSENVLLSIPSEIGNLTNLKSLYLNDNLLQKIPKEIGNLQNLEKLLLKDNGLIKIPNEVCKLDTSNGGTTEVDIIPGVLCEFILGDPLPNIPGL